MRNICINCRKINKHCACNFIWLKCGDFRCSNGSFKFLRINIWLTPVLCCVTVLLKTIKCWIYSEYWWFSTLTPCLTYLRFPKGGCYSTDDLYCSLLETFCFTDVKSALFLKNYRRSIFFYFEIGKLEHVIVRQTSWGFYHSNWSSCIGLQSLYNKCLRRLFFYFAHRRLYVNIKVCSYRKVWLYNVLEFLSTSAPYNLMKSC